MYNRHEHINPNNRNNCFNNNYLHRYQTSRRKRRYKNSFFRCSNWLGSIWSNPHVYKWFISAAIGGIVWFFALKWLYNLGWLKTIVVAVILWIVASIVGVILPTGMGPF